MKSSVEKLCERLKNELGIEADPKDFRRTRCSRHQKAAGYFSWNIGRVGSRETISDLLKAKKIEYTTDPLGEITLR